jgi:hypothetical protein
MARVIMRIANAGTAGHYWPEPQDWEPLAEPLKEKLSSFDRRCRDLHRTLFVPPFDTTVRDINVPLMVASGHFRVQTHLLELLPLLCEGEPVGEDGIKELLGKDSNLPMQDMIINADETIRLIERKLDHIGGPGNGSLSLALVPLIYWYNRRAGFVRALMFGWMNWLLSGSDAEVQDRKIAFCSVRGELEDALVRYKDEFADIQHRAGAGLKSLYKITNFLQDLTSLLIETRGAEDEVREKRLVLLFGAKPSGASSKGGKSRSFSKNSRAEINVRSLLGSPMRCEICGGVVDLKQGVQYDHKQHYSAGGASSPENGRATHPFCNLFRERITNLRAGKEKFDLPPLSSAGGKERPFVQLNLFEYSHGE